MGEEVCGAIIAGGKGTRATLLSFEYPKPILPIANKPIMQYQIELMKELGIKKVFIIVACLKKKIMDYFGDGKSFGVDIEYIDVEDNYPEGLAKAVGRLEGKISSSFLLFLGDIFCKFKNIEAMKRFIENSPEKAFIVVKKEHDPDAIRRNFSVELKQGNKVKRVIEKPEKPKSNIKGCGIYFLPTAIFKAVKKTKRSSLRNEFELTDAIQIMIDKKIETIALNVVAQDMNLTFVGDLLAANMKWLEEKKLKNLIAENAKINKNAVLKKCVVGKNVEIRNPVLLENCVVFDDVVIPHKNNLRNAIITPMQSILL